VEWLERNETKGKEIELEALYALNQSLLAKKAPPPSVTPSSCNFFLLFIIN
jgi:hypothetical protein